MTELLDQIIARVNNTSPKEREKLMAAARKVRDSVTWIPNPGPQTEAYLSDADIIHYGGQAGGGKTQLLLGAAINDAQNGIIFRRELSQTDGLESDGKTIIAGSAKWNGQDHEWNWGSGKTLKLGGMKEPDSWMGHAGRERDFIGYDEAGEFLEQQVASMMAWLRAGKDRRTRMILASNPPRSAEGRWIIDWFAPWLDPKHHLYGAQDGELLWAVYVSQPDGSGRTIWVDGPGAYEIDGEEYMALSRTFIHASLEDNPYRNNPEYRAKLQSLPEPLRSQLLYGDYRAGLKDAADQCVPTDWVRAAIARWTQKPPEGVPMCSIGADCSGGGDDPFVLAIRHDGWFAPMVRTEGKDMPRDRLGSHAAGIVMAQRRDRALVVVDMGGGYGGSLYEHLKDNDVETYAYKGAEGTSKRTKDGTLGFSNVRSAAYWGFREALDPGQPGGSPIMLPNDSRLIAGLCAPKYKVTSRGIQVEPKSKQTGEKGVVERLGFSPDEADSVVMSWWGGPRALTNALDWVEQRAQSKRGMTPKVIMGRHHRR